MDSVGLFEAKTKFSELCDRVAKNKEPIIVTKRGEPLVVIAPTGDKTGRKSVWMLRRSFEAAHGKIRENLILPRRVKSKKIMDFLDD